MHALILALSPLLAAAPVQDQKPTADGLIEQAWKLLPAYTGDHRAYLNADDRRDVQAASYMLEAATALEPDHSRGLWSLGHAHILLGEDSRNRGHRADAQEHYAALLRNLDHAIEIDPIDPWALYARGTAHSAFGDYESALKDLDGAANNAAAQLDENGEPTNTAWLRFKALGWTCDTLMNTRDYERARVALVEYHTEFSENQWPLFIALAETHERARNFDGALAEYDRAIELFPEDYQAHSTRGYVYGLLGDTEEATRCLSRSVEVELQVSLYPRLWLWMLATEDASQAAAEDLAELLVNPPQQIGSWDLRLGRFMMGEEGPSRFLAAAHAEMDRRIDAGENVDDLICEVQFYIGFALERGAAGDPVKLTQALEHYRAALLERPSTWKWEWAFARNHFTSVAAKLKKELEPGYSLKGSEFQSAELTGTLSAASWCVAGRSQPFVDPDYAPKSGDLLLAKIQTSEGRSVHIEHVVGVGRLPESRSKKE